MNEQTRRRWMGGVALGIAVLMLALGETALKSRLQGGFLTLLYWGVCFVLTISAAIVALRDLKDIQRDAGREHRDLLTGAIQEIEKDAKSKKITR